MLREQLNEECLKALKSKEELKTSVLRLLLTAIKNKEFEKRNKLSKTETDVEKLEKASQLNEEEIMAVIATEAKKRQDSIKQYQAGNREELAVKEEAELKILSAYLPEQLPEDEIRKLVKEAISESGASGFKEIGKVMKVLMPRIKGKADGDLVNKIAKEELGQ